MTSAVAATSSLRQNATPSPLRTTPRSTSPATTIPRPAIVKTAIDREPKRPVLLIVRHGVDHGTIMDLGTEACRDRAPEPRRASGSASGHKLPRRRHPSPGVGFAPATTFWSHVSTSARALGRPAGTALVGSRALRVAFGQLFGQQLAPTVAQTGLLGSSSVRERAVQALCSRGNRCAVADFGSGCSEVLALPPEPFPPATWRGTVTGRAAPELRQTSLRYPRLIRSQACAKRCSASSGHRMTDNACRAFSSGSGSFGTAQVVRLPAHCNGVGTSTVTQLPGRADLAEYIAVSASRSTSSGRS